MLFQVACRRMTEKLWSATLNPKHSTTWVAWKTCFHTHFTVREYLSSSWRDNPWWFLGHFCGHYLQMVKFRKENFFMNSLYNTRFSEVFYTLRLSESYCRVNLKNAIVIFFVIKLWGFFIKCRVKRLNIHLKKKYRDIMIIKGFFFCFEL